MTKRLITLCLMPLCACSNEANQIGIPFLLPVSAISTGIGNAAYNQRRGEVERIVKSNFPGILDEIAMGEGASFDAAMNAARIQEADRPARTLQLRGDLALYAQNPGALVTALMVYGS